MKIFDVIVIGGGLAGLTAAAVAASRRQSVAVLLGQTLRETEMTRAIYELSMNISGGDTP